MRIRFSTKTILILTTIVAAVFGGRLTLKHFLSINPETRRVCVAGEIVNLNSEDLTWQPGHSGIWSENDLFHSAQIPSPNDQVRLEQNLLTIDYNNHLSLCDFSAAYRIEGYRSENWENYVFQIIKHGIGTDDIAVVGKFDFDPKIKVLQVEILTWINSKKLARRSMFKFKYDGSAFVLAE